MIKRTIEISGDGNRLSIALGQLVIRREDQVVGQIPVEDIGLLILDSQTTSYTHAVLTECLAAGAVILPCGKNHHPCALLLPQENTLQTQRLLQQVRSSVPLRKSLWKQIVQAKVRAQAAVLDEGCPAARAMLNLVPEVRSGDPANIEAQAARLYWPALLGEDFRRDPDGAAPNLFLNYGYTVLRASVARAICGAGLHPSLGVHHRNRSNTFCLADDLLEPLRPLVDRKVKALHQGGAVEINRETKSELLTLLTAEVEVAGEKGPLMVGLVRMAASLVRCYAGEQKKLDLPNLWS